jgi:hypothetical protein
MKLNGKSRVKEPGSIAGVADYMFGLKEDLTSAAR